MIRLPGVAWCVLVFIVGALQLINSDWLQWQLDSSVSSVQTDAEGQLDKAQQAILSGQDPTDVLAPTAAGVQACYAGVVIGRENASDLSALTYVSVTERGQTFIRVSRFSPIFLTQSSTQAVTATRLDRLPSSVVSGLEQGFDAPERCQQKDLYLTAIKPD